MDDILVLAPTRWKLRRAVRLLNQVLSSLELEKHPEKTFIGRIEKGFDFLGYHFSRAELTVARATLENFAARALRLYEQERGKQDGFPRLGEYIRRGRGLGCRRGMIVMCQGLGVVPSSSMAKSKSSTGRPSRVLIVKVVKRVGVAVWQ